MKRLTFAAVLCVSQVAHAQLSLVWSDEFDGTSINSANWEHMIGDGSAYGIPGWGNNELQLYTNDAANSYVSGGSLHIVATKPSSNQYRSARLRSLNKVDFQYGRIEARIKVPAGQGLWPAFWMLPTNSPYGGWAASGEIDLLETINNADQAYGTIHFGDNWPGNVSNGGNYWIGEPISNDFHVYRFDWEADEVRWYMDGIQYHSVNSNNWWSNAAPGNNRAPFDNPFHFLLNVAVGGNWPGSPNGSTPFPSEMQIDYVRLYQVDTGGTGFQNGSFEIQGSPLAGWTDFGNNIPNILWSQLLPSEGASHAKLFGQFIGGDNDCGVYQDVDAAPGEIWTASVQAAHEGFDAIEGANNGFMSLEFLNIGGSVIDSNPIETLDASSPTDAYQLFSVTATAPADTAEARIVLGFHQDASNPRAGAIYYDEADLVVAPGACSPADVTTQGAGAGDPLFGMPDGTVTAADINFYVNAWVALDTAIADLTTQGSGPGDPGYAQPDGIVTASDINFYVNIWLFGCP